MQQLVFMGQIDRSCNVGHVIHIVGRDTLSRVENWHTALVDCAADMFAVYEQVNLADADGTVGFRLLDCVLHATGGLFQIHDHTLAYSVGRTVANSADHNVAVLARVAYQGANLGGPDLKGGNGCCTHGFS